MADAEFTPFIARRLKGVMHPDDSTNDLNTVIVDDGIVGGDAADGNVGGATSVSPMDGDKNSTTPEASIATATNSDAHRDETNAPGMDIILDGDDPATDVAAATSVAPEASGVSDTPCRQCRDHTIEIRNEAVRLAAIACGRALRHALVLHPQVIAAFVDDALRSAGNPSVRCIRVHPDLVNTLHLRSDVTGDVTLEPGEVQIEFDGSGVGADILTRATMLVAAAAES